MPEFEQDYMSGPGPESPYAAMIDDLRGLLDDIAGAGPDDAAVAALSDDIAALRARLQPLRVDETGQMFGRVRGVPGHGQTLCPAFTVDAQTDDGLDGRVTFGRFFLGANGAAHGGAVALLFDELLGLPANFASVRMARTAYLHVNYRSITPIERELTFAARITSRDGRKRIVTGELRDGDTLCADAEGLFVELKPGQP